MIRRIYMAIVFIFLLGSTSNQFVRSSDEHNEQNPSNRNDELSKSTFKTVPNHTYANNKSTNTLNFDNSDFPLKNKKIYKKLSKKDQQNRYLKILHSNEQSKSIDNERNLMNSLADTNFVKPRTRRAVNFRQNLCKTDCNCETSTNFAIVECHFQLDDQYVIDSTKSLPKDTSSLRIKLSTNTKLILDENIFNGKSINSLVIEGSQLGKEIVEINSNAFRGNNGVFPEINITNIRTVLLRKNAFTDMNKSEPNEFKLHVQYAQNVIIQPQAFNNSRFHGFFLNINDLRINEKGFYGTFESVITIANSNIETFYKLESLLKGIKFIRTNITKIVSEAFNVVSVSSIIFQKCIIDTIESKVFTEKLYSTHLEFVGCKIRVIETNAIDHSGINRVVFENNDIQTIQPNAIAITTVNVSFSYNVVRHLGKEWLKINSWHNITIYNNTFGAYNLIKIENTPNPIICLFEKNSIMKPEPGSLNITHYNCKIRETYFYQDCKCEMDWIEKLTSVNIKDSSYCRIEDVLKRCFNASVFNVQKYKEQVCGESSSVIECLKHQNKIKTGEHFIDPQEIIDDPFDTNIILYASLCVVGIILIISILVIIYFIYKHCKLKRKPITMPLTQIDNKTFNSATMKNSKSFSTDDRFIINQTLEKMKIKQSAEKYDQVYNNTQKLLEGNLTESDKVFTIGEIVKTIEECQNTGEDFVAFTGILYNHLAPKNNNDNDPVYAEPNLPMDDLPTEIYNRDDHIYAEPHSVQQPLLRSEYASPLDRNDVDLGNLYSEPILNEKEKAVITPYAIGNQCISPSIINNQPSTSKNLPDVLSQSTNNQKPPINNIQTLANKFANNPKFHIQRSPTTNRKIPQYTIPNKLIATTSSQSQKPKDTTDGIVNINPYKTKPHSNNNNDSDSSNSHSDYSGGSDVTFKIDEIEYADA